MKKTIEEKMGILIFCFILFSPLIDVISGITNKSASPPLGVGIIARGTLYVLLLGYLAYNIVKISKKPKINHLVMGMLFFIGVSFLVNFISKDPFSLTSEIIFLFKASYFYIIFLFLWNWLKGKGKIEKLFYPITVASLVYNLFIWVPTFLGLSFNSYAHLKQGSVGWFNAANEVGALISILFPLVVLETLWLEKQTGKSSAFRKVFNFITLLAFIPSFNVMGTKVTFVAGMFYCLMMMVYYIYKSFKNKKDIFKATMFMLSIIFLLSSPTIDNTKKHFQTMEDIEVQTETNVVEQSEGEIEWPDPIHPFINKILSDRDVYLVLHSQYFNDAPIERKIAGLGYASEYDIKPKTIEMDFFDGFFSFGFGFTILFVLFVLSVANIIFKNAKNITDWFEKGIVVMPIIVVSGISFLTGHVMFAPSVSFFWAMLLIIVMRLYKKENEMI